MTLIPISGQYSDPPIIPIYLAFTKVMLVISSLFYPVMLYLVLFKSSKLKEYKYYLLPIITFAYLFELLMVICQPVVIFPVFGGYARGLIRNTSSTVACFFMVLIVLSAGYTILGIMYSMLFRYKIIAPKIIKKWINIKWIYHAVIAYGYVVATIIICSWMLLIKLNEENLDAFILANPEYADLASREPTLTIFKTNEFMLSNAFCLTYFISIFVIIVTFFIIFHLEKRLYDQKSKLSPTTFKLQKMMNTYFKAELLSTHLFVLYPFTIVTIVMHTKNPYTATVYHGALMFGSLYCVFLYSSLIYFIKPYRVWLLKMFFMGIRCKSNNAYHSASTS